VHYLVKEYHAAIGAFDATVRTLRYTMAADHVAQDTDLQATQETLGISVAATEKSVSLSKQTARRAF
jgi:hypothetical protein